MIHGDTILVANDITKTWKVSWDFHQPSYLRLWLHHPSILRHGDATVAALEPVYSEGIIHWETTRGGKKNMAFLG